MSGVNPFPAAIPTEPRRTEDVNNDQEFWDFLGIDTPEDSDLASSFSTIIQSIDNHGELPDTPEKDNGNIWTSNSKASSNSLEVSHSSFPRELQDISVQETCSLKDIENLLLRSAGLMCVPFLLPRVVSQRYSMLNQHMRASPAVFDPQLEEELTHLYFESVHSLCPVVDELEFYKWYYHQERDSSQIMQKLLLYAILFAVFAHASEDHLRRCGFASVPEGQKALFDLVKTFYHDIVEHYEGEVALVQTALLLSHWTPYDQSKEVNSFWVDEAFRHAMLAKLYEGKDSHHRVIWWCCFVRNRFVSLGLHQQTSLKDFETGPMLKVSDFGLNVLLPKHRISSITSRVTMIELFISLCELSELMYAVIKLRKLPLDNHSKSIILERNESNIEHLGQVMEVDRMLSLWIRNYNTVAARYHNKDLGRYGMIYVRVMRILAMSTMAFLYEPYMCSPPDRNSLSWLMGNVAVSKVRGASSSIASEVGNLLSDATVEEVPFTVPAWIVLPLAVHLVEINSTPTSTGGDNWARFGNLMRLLRAMKSRFKGVEYISRVIDGVIETITRLCQSGHRQQTSDLQVSAPGADIRLEALITELLIKAAEILRAGLAKESSNR